MTVRIFCVTALILLAASAVTFGIVALATPITYMTIAVDQMNEEAVELVTTLEQTDFEDCGPLLDEFVLTTKADVMVRGESGEIVNTPSNLSIRVVYEDDSTVVTTARAQRVGEATVTEDGTVTVYTVTSDELDYPFAFRDREEVYTLCVSPGVEQVNQTMQALGRVAPWLLGAMLLFSLLGALFYSRYITRPIVRLSGISQKMAGLDFSWRCGERRADEIGVLGRNLDELSGRLSDALSELQTANAALRRDIDQERELERQRLAFFSAASHELKTPLTILKGQLTGMLEGVDIYQDRDKYLAKSLQVTGRMENLVQEILTVSRMERSGFALCRQTVDLGALTAQKLLEDEDLLLQKELHLEPSIQTGVSVSADPALLRKVLDNLLSNAAFYAPEGAALRVGVEMRAGRALLYVENTGSRIPEEALPHVFEAFYRADSSRDRRTGGSGLGLYVVKMVLDRHGAECRAENTADGVRFAVLF